MPAELRSYADYVKKMAPDTKVLKVPDDKVSLSLSNEEIETAFVVDEFEKFLSTVDADLVSGLEAYHERQRKEAANVDSGKVDALLDLLRSGSKDKLDA